MFRAAALVMLQGSRSEAASTLAHGAVAVPWRSGAAVVQSLVPSLSYSKHKGQAGRIGVVGGSLEYTGAPYYAAASTLQLGADLSWVFAAHEAAIPIKSYSPELIVLPTYKSEMDEASVRSTLVATVEPWLDRLHGLVVGPGLGRRSSVMDGVSRLVEIAARERRMPVVVDADGLFLVAQRPELVTGCPNVMLTPNAPEFERLKRRVLKRVGERSGPDADAKDLVDVCRALGGVTVVKKGRVDLISDGRAILAVDEMGAPRRCGGIGDILSGSASVLAVWANRSEDRELVADDAGLAASPLVWAAYGACVLTRRAAAAAFEHKRRAMTAPDVLRCVADAFELMCPTVVEPSPR